MIFQPMRIREFERDTRGPVLQSSYSPWCSDEIGICHLPCAVLLTFRNILNEFLSRFPDVARVVVLVGDRWL